MLTSSLDINIFVGLVAKPPVRYSWGWGTENAVDQAFRERWAALVYAGAASMKSVNKRNRPPRGLWGRQGTGRGKGWARGQPRPRKPS